MSVQFNCLEQIKTIINNIDWVITESTKTLYFKEDDGEATEITLTADIYSTSDLETHIKNTLENSFSHTYTISYENNVWIIKIELDPPGDSNGTSIQYIDEDSTAGDILGYTENSRINTIISSDTNVFPYIKYVDYYTTENMEKIGKRYPAVLINDSDEEWSPAGNGQYDIMHAVEIYIFTQINQDRIENILEYQKKIIDEIDENNTLDGNAICTNIISVEKGEINRGEGNLENIGFSDNITIRKIIIQIWERE